MVIKKTEVKKENFVKSSYMLSDNSEKNKEFINHLRRSRHMNHHTILLLPSSEGTGKSFLAKELHKYIEKEYRPIKWKKAWELVGLWLVFILLFKVLQLLILVFVGLDAYTFLMFVGSILMWVYFLKPLWEIIINKK